MPTIFVTPDGDLVSLGDLLVAEYGDDLLTVERAKRIMADVAEGVLTPYRRAA